MASGRLARASASAEELHRFLDPVRFEREALYWDGVAVGVNATGTLNFGGGAKGSRGRVTATFLGPDTSAPNAPPRRCRNH